MALFALAAGCVPKARHEVVEVQLHATRTALSAKAASCTTAEQHADDQREALQAEISLRQSQLDELAARGAAQADDRLRLEADRLALVDEVQRLQHELEEARAGKRGPAPTDNAPAPAVAVAREGLVADLAAVASQEIAAARVTAARDAVVEAFLALSAEGLVAVEARGDAAVLRIPTRVLFQEGFTTLSPRGQALVERIAAGLATVPGRRITVEGHTDDRPVHTAEMASNWERGFSRAVAVLRGLEGAGAPATLSVASFANTRPLVPNDAPDAAILNPRVELRIEVDPELTTRFSPTPEEAPEEDVP